MSDTLLDALMMQSYSDWAQGIQALYGVGAFGRTPEGRPLVPHAGSFATEYSATVQDPRLNEGLWTNIPTIYGGQFVEPEEAMETIVDAGGYDPETGRRLIGYRTLEAAELAAQQRTKELDVQLQNRFRRLERRER